MSLGVVVAGYPIEEVLGAGGMGHGYAPSTTRSK